jgi:uncharacterized protein (TIGR02145 family)
VGTKIIVYIRLLIFTLYISILSIGCKEKDELIFAPITFNPSVTYGSMTDQDGNTYKTVTIGTQVWMAENLKTTKYQNSDPIQNVTDTINWRKLKTGAYCSYENENRNINAYGLLYNWYAVNDSRNLAPSGWHIATDAEWNILTTFLGGESVAIGKLKEIGTKHWSDPNSEATNECGFTALPGGFRGNLSFGSANLGYHDWYKGIWGSWWSPETPTLEYVRGRLIWSGSVTLSNIKKGNGASVRCVKDN